MRHQYKASKEVQAQLIDFLRKSNIEVHSFSTSHFRLGGPQGTVDYWPSSDRWWNRSTNEKGLGVTEAIQQMTKKRDPRGSGMYYPPVPQKQPRLVDVTNKPPACIDCTASFEFDDGELVCRFNPPTVLQGMSMGVFPTVDENWACKKFEREGTK